MFNQENKDALYILAVKEEKCKSFKAQAGIAVEEEEGWIAVFFFKVLIEYHISLIFKWILS